MFKTVVIAALGFAAVSAQFLNLRNLQNTTTSTFSTAACTVAATGVESGCNTAGYCCATYTKTGTTVTTPANLCVATDFLGQNITIQGTTYSFRSTCLSANITAPVRAACSDDTGCAVGECCSNVTLVAGLATNNGTVARRFCNAGQGNSWAANYAANTWLASYTASVRYAACTPNAPPAESFGAYIKASVMMVVAVLSVAFF
jgi:hypothetical protein